MGLQLAQANSTNRFQSAWFAAAKGPAYSQARSGKIQHQPFRIVQTQRLASQAAITFHAYDCLVAAATAADLDLRDDRSHGGGRGRLNRWLRIRLYGAACPCRRLLLRFSESGKGSERQTEHCEENSMAARPAFRLHACLASGIHHTTHD